MKTLGMMLCICAFLAVVGAVIISGYEHRLMNFSIGGFVEEEVRAAAEDIGDRLDTQGKLLRQVALSHIARQYLEAPATSGPIYDGLLRDLRTLVLSEPMVHIAYVQSSRDYSCCCQSDGWIPAEGYRPTGQSWYDLPVARGESVVTPPYLERAGESIDQMGKPMISVAMPVDDSAGKLLGVAALDILLTPSQKLFSPVRLRTRGYTIIVASDGSVLYGPHTPMGDEALPVLEHVRDYPIAEKVIAANEPVLRLRDPETGKWVWAGMGAIPVPGWRIVMVFPEEGLAEEFGRFKTDLIELGIVGISVFILLTVLFSLRVSREERGLLRDRELYRGMFSDAPIAACTTDPEGRIADANRAFLSLTGAERAAVIGVRLSEIVHPDDASRAGGLLRKAGEEGISAGELRFAGADGSFAVCEASATPLSGPQPGALIIVRDATREKRRERRIGELEAELQDLNRIMVQREFRVKELRERIRELEKGAGRNAGG